MMQLNCGRTNQTDFRYCESCPRQSWLTHTEGRVLLSLWYIGRSPLMFGGFLPETDSATIALLANHAALGANTWGRNVSRQVAPATTLAPASPKLEAWVSTDARDTSGKTFFVGLFNFMDGIAPQTVTATLPAACEVAKQVTDLWTLNESRARTWSQDADGAARVSRKVGPHDSALLSVQCGTTRSIPMKVDDMGPIPRGVAAVAAADMTRNNTVELGRFRVTVHTSRVLRLEYAAATGQFENRPSLLWTKRDLAEAPFTHAVKDGALTLRTEHLALTYSPSASATLGRSASLRFPGELKVQLAAAGGGSWTPASGGRSCGLSGQERRQCGAVGVSQAQCEALGCCYMAPAKGTTIDVTVRALPGRSSALSIPQRSSI
jgi:hypothetical protein